MPDDNSWPSIRSDLQSCSLNLPNYPGRDLKTLAPRLEDSGIDLLKYFLKCNPRSRISAQEAMYHTYFNSLPSAIHNLSDSESIFSLSSIRLSKEITSRQKNDEKL